MLIADHRSSILAIISSWAVEEWVVLFANPVLRTGAFGRLANASYQIVMDSNCYREKLFPRGPSWLKFASAMVNGSVL